MPSRGRPALNDGPILHKVAMKLAQDQVRTARSAILQSLDLPSDSNVRRLQRKWRKHGGDYLREARQMLTQQREQMRRAREEALAAVRSEAFNPLGSFGQPSLIGLPATIDHLGGLAAAVRLSMEPMASAAAAFREAERIREEQAAHARALDDLVRQAREWSKAAALPDLSFLKQR